MKVPKNFKMHGLIAYLEVKFVVDDKGEVHQVKCMICTSIEGKDKLLAPKLNSLLKHAGRWKCKVSMPSVECSPYGQSQKIL